MVYEGIIRGKTVDFRSVEERDAMSTLNMRMNPELNKFLNKVDGSIEKQREYIKAQREKVGDYLFIAEDKDGKPVGMRGIYNYDPQKNECETGRLIGKGNAVQNTEIAMFGYDFAFEFLKVKLIKLTVIEDNKNVLSGHKRFGAVEVSREYLEQFGSYLITSELSPERYYERRPSIKRLIDMLG